MNNKVYTVRYYIDWETHGLDSIFKYKEDAEKLNEVLAKFVSSTLSGVMEVAE